VRRRCFAYRVARNRHRCRIDGSAGRRKRDRLVRAGNEGLYGGLCPAVGHLLHGRVYEGNARAASAVGFALQDISPAARRLNLKGQLLIKAKADVTGKVYYELPSVLWVAPGKVLGGNVGFGAIVPFGSKDFDLDALARTETRSTDQSDVSTGPTLQIGLHNQLTLVRKKWLA
jgi:hypothetical protein